MFRRHFHNTKRNREGFEFGFGRGQERFGGPQGRERFFKIAQIIKQKNNDLAAQKLEHSIQVIEVLEQALDSANIKVGPSQK